MKYYAAPMEGVTGYVYRNAHFHHFSGVDCYYTPFLTPKKKKGMTTREKNDILPEHNQGIRVVPQIMTCKSEDFVVMAARIKEYGYDEVNLNLGCPSGTVVAKGKGCGFLADPDGLERFFQEVFDHEEYQKLGLRLSVKTRLGVEDPWEIKRLMEIYNAYPISEVIIHARILKDFYKLPVRLEPFGEALDMSKHPVCYNGDLFCPEDVDRFKEAFPQVDRIMIGRGMLRNPQLFEEIRQVEDDRLHADNKQINEDQLTKTVKEAENIHQASGGFPAKEYQLADKTHDFPRWKAFLDELCDQYEVVMSGDRNALFKLKEVWNSMILEMPESDRLAKKIKKARTLSEYRIAVNELFAQLS